MFLPLLELEFIILPIAIMLWREAREGRCLRDGFLRTFLMARDLILVAVILSAGGGRRKTAEAAIFVQAELDRGGERIDINAGHFAAIPRRTHLIADAGGDRLLDLRG